MIKHFFTNSIGILFSRILGFIRDVMSASVLGASIYSDIFFVAFKIPNLFRRIFGEGAFSQTFIPFYASCVKKIVFANYIFYKFIFIILSLSIFVSIFPEVFANIFTMGFDKATQNLITPVLAINFYYLDFIFIIMILSAILQYKYHFATSSFAPALLNIAIISSIWLSYDKMPLEVVYYMSYGVLAGGILQTIAHIIAIKYYRLDRIFKISILNVFKKKHTIQNDIKKFNNSFLYSILGNSTAHISAFIDTFLASFLISGSISYLYYANRIFQLPMALFSIALSISLFPILTKMIKENLDKKAISYMQKGFYFLLFTLSFASIIGVIFAKEIIWLLFERGEFSKIDTINSANVLIMYMIGLLPFGLSKIFSIWLYSKKMHKISAKISAYSLGVNIVLSIILVYYMEILGLALASSISGFVLLILSIKNFGYEKFVIFLRNKIMLYYIYFIGVCIVVFLYLSSFLKIALLL